jgi:hypothetical protein
MDDCHEGAKRIAQQLRQLHDIDRDPPRLIFAEVTRITAPSYPNL